jgi:hypothetical protein
MADAPAADAPPAPPPVRSVKWTKLGQAHLSAREATARSNELLQSWRAAVTATAVRWAARRCACGFAALARVAAGCRTPRPAR